jgi:hypothetical protein
MPLTAGLVRHACSEILSHPGELGGLEAGRDVEEPGSLSACGTRSEALQLWRCCALHGHYILSLDDAMVSLARYSSPEPLPDPAAGGGGAALSALRRWALWRELLLTAAQLCWDAARCVGPPLSPASPCRHLKGIWLAIVRQAAMCGCGCWVWGVGGGWGGGVGGQAYRRTHRHTVAGVLGRACCACWNNSRTARPAPCRAPAGSAPAVTR